MQEFVARNTKAMKTSMVLLPRQVRLWQDRLMVSPMLMFVDCIAGTMEMSRVWLQRQASL